MKRIVLILLVGIAVAGCRKQEQADPAVATTAPAAETSAAAAGSEVGSRLPEYSAMWLDGRKFELEKSRGKVVLLNLWATWCGPCRYEIPELQDIHNQYASRGFEVIGVSVDESGVEPVREFVEEYKMTYPVVLDAEGKLAVLLQTSVLPTTVLLDREGTIVWKKYGAVMPNDQELTQAIEKAL